MENMREIFPTKFQIKDIGSYEMMEKTQKHYEEQHAVKRKLNTLIKVQLSSNSQRFRYMLLLCIVLTKEKIKKCRWLCNDLGRVLNKEDNG